MAEGGHFVHPFARRLSNEHRNTSKYQVWLYSYNHSNTSDFKTSKHCPLFLAGCIIADFDSLWVCGYRYRSMVVYHDN